MSERTSGDPPVSTSTGAPQGRIRGARGRQQKTDEYARCPWWATRSGPFPQERTVESVGADMAVDTTVQVTLPQMGESVTEGTVLEWRKQEGDRVEADEVARGDLDRQGRRRGPRAGERDGHEIHVAEGDTVRSARCSRDRDRQRRRPGRRAQRRNGGRRRDRRGQRRAGCNGSADAGRSRPTTAAAARDDRHRHADRRRVGHRGHDPRMAREGRRRRAADETIVEISTDKVDVELPAPATGTVTEILVAEGETVTVGQVIARIARDAMARSAATPAGAGRRRRPTGPRRAGRQRRRRPTRVSPVAAPRGGRRGRRPRGRLAAAAPPAASPRPTSSRRRQRRGPAPPTAAAAPRGRRQRRGR